MSQHNSEGMKRRADKRRSYDLQVGIATKHRLFVGLTANISTGGLFISTDEELSRGDRVEVKFQIPGSDHVFVKSGEVVWTRPFDQNQTDRQAQAGAGLKLIDLSDEELAILNAFIDAHDPMYFDT
ncbi:MAG TPA: hypothetical protein DCQ06_10775 [Myxococcales bacterium]|nr:hypothetical protein [Myxococcales bacterium]HAN32070.1 hypothetical protein [Myxococcales bacterium]|tara:strand:+ start:912 stop:1289 length:378 start_codon:yes stop_codon:yes gene_type:complete